MTLTNDVRATLAEISTATLTTVLLKKGIRNAYMRGPKPLREGGPRLVGPAFTMRFIPAREDLAVPEAWASPRSTRAAIEAMTEGVIAVADARGVTEAAIFGDILVARMAKRGAAALVTDGTMRDAAGVAATGLPVWCTGAAAPSSVAGHIFVGWEEPIGCGGVAIFPGDIIVADGDGAVVIPPPLAAEVAKLGAEQERFEAWAMAEVEKGVPLPGLYPPNEAAKARYEANKKR
jgi:regulator of RNase E activity RraA